MSGIAEFVELKQALNSALHDGKFHLLLGIDERIRQVSTRVFDSIRQDVKGNQDAVNEVREVIGLYRQAIDVCQEQSDRAKQEYLKSVNNKQGTARYLQVAGIRYGNTP
jgi:hypothetical protein